MPLRTFLKRRKSSEMSSSAGKLFLCLAVTFCAVQIISARPRLDENFLENVKFDLTKKCNGVESDIEKETNNVVHKLVKESSKLFKKAVKGESRECIESAKLQAQEDLEEKTQEALECVQELRDSLDSDLTPETNVNDVLSFRQVFKNKLQQCKKTGKESIKGVQSQFSIAGKQCLV